MPGNRASLPGRLAANIRPGQVLFPLGLGTALSLMGDATLYTVLPTHTVDAGITVAGVGIILGVNRAIRLLTNGPAGLAYDRAPRRLLFVPSLFIGALSTAIYAATSGFWPLFVGRLLWGLAWSGIWVGGATMILDVTSVGDRGRWTGLYQTWFFLGTSLGSLLGGVLTDAVGYSSTMWIGAALTFAGAVAALVLLPETQHAQPEHRRQASDVVLDPGPLRANSALWVAVSLQGINRFVVSGVLSATLGLVVQQQLKSTAVGMGVATATGFLMSGRSFLSMGAAPLCGVLSDRWHSRWLVTAWVVLLGAVGVLLMAWGNIGGLLLGIALSAIAGGGIQSLATTLTGDLVSRAQRGRAIGLLQTSNDLGSALGPPVAYALMPVFALSGVYLLCAALFAAGFVLALYYQRKLGGRDQFTAA